MNSCSNSKMQKELLDGRESTDKRLREPRVVSRLDVPLRESRDRFCG